MGETKIKVEGDEERLGIREFRVFQDLGFERKKNIWVSGLGFSKRGTEGLDNDEK